MRVGPDHSANTVLVKSNYPQRRHKRVVPQTTSFDSTRAHRLSKHHNGFPPAPHVIATPPFHGLPKLWVRNTCVQQPRASGRAQRRRRPLAYIPTKDSARLRCSGGNAVSVNFPRAAVYLCGARQRELTRIQQGTRWRAHLSRTPATTRADMSGTCAVACAHTACPGSVRTISLPASASLCRLRSCTPAHNTRVTGADNKRPSRSCLRFLFTPCVHYSARHGRDMRRR